MELTTNHNTTMLLVLGKYTRRSNGIDKDKDVDKNNSPLNFSNI